MKLSGISAATRLGQSAAADRQFSSTGNGSAKSLPYDWQDQRNALRLNNQGAPMP